MMRMLKSTFVKYHGYDEHADVGFLIHNMNVGFGCCELNKGCQCSSHECQIPYFGFILIFSFACMFSLISLFWGGRGFGGMGSALCEFWQARHESKECMITLSRNYWCHYWHCISCLEYWVAIYFLICVSKSCTGIYVKSPQLKWIYTYINIFKYICRQIFKLNT